MNVFRDVNFAFWICIKRTVCLCE